jgi:pSer/pThr/pTyr-binding forkhead associated (FHA) protein
VQRPPAPPQVQPVQFNPKQGPPQQKPIDSGKPPAKPQFAQAPQGFNIKDNPRIDSPFDAPTVGPDEDGDTVMESVGTMMYESAPARLINSKTGEAFLVGKEFFNIGRSEAFADLHLNSMHVGREHCRIFQKDSGYFITDLGSKNHTFVDGAQLADGKPVQLKDGSRIKVADEEFNFRLGS